MIDKAKCEEAASMIRNIMIAIKEVMSDGKPTTLIFMDAKITIEKLPKELSPADMDVLEKML